MTEVQLKWHNFGQWESFRGLVDIPGKCLLYVSLGGAYGLGAISSRRKQISAIAAVDYTAYDVTSRFSITRKVAARSFGAYIAVSPQIHCNPSSYIKFKMLVLKSPPSRNMP